MANVDYGENAADYLVTLTLADTEYSLVFPDGVKKFEIMPRSNDIRHSFVAGRVAASSDSALAPYQILPGDENYWQDKLYLNQHILYMGTSSADTKVQVRLWF